MTREELEKELEVHGWKKSYHGTDSEIWNNGRRHIELNKKGIFYGYFEDFNVNVPYEKLSILDGKLVIHREVEL